MLSDEVARQLQYCWQQNSHWHQTMHRQNGVMESTECAHLEWTDALKILSAFEGVPCIEEIVFCLDELYDAWYETLNRRRQDYASFLDFVRWRTELPVGCWLYDMDRQPENNYQRVRLAVEDQREETLIYAAYADESYLPSAWERHCALIDEWREQGKTSQEIFQQLPLDLPEWPAQAQKMFRQYHLNNLYQALRFIYTELTQNDLQIAKQIIKAYLYYSKR